jgi:hypothetical protein
MCTNGHTALAIVRTMKSFCHTFNSTRSSPISLDDHGILGPAGGATMLAENGRAGHWKCFPAASIF